GNKTREQTLSLQGKKQREALQQLHFITSKLCNYVSKLICNWTCFLWHLELQQNQTHQLIWWVV
ncbi:MAG: hypothetical protein PHF89_07985, partial [Eubacteriales bacterium]|nr:hypothetical protein [Eubacteriales bacterium]